MSGRLLWLRFLGFSRGGLTGFACGFACCFAMSCGRTSIMSRGIILCCSGGFILWQHFV
jgi:hypothetical protein